MNTFRNAVLGSAAALAVAATTLLPAGDAAAQQFCFVHDEAVEQLAQRFGEKVTARGLTQDGSAMIEVFSSERGSWTLVRTDVNGRSCVVATGKAWDMIKPVRGRVS